jgi:SAM-dependent methyltransferase
VEQAGTPLDELGTLLDFGCGCGRVLRHWVHLENTRVTGCDVNPKMVGWCRENLPFADVAVNDSTPPLGHEDSSLGLVYAFSVFTHLTEPAQHAWMRELGRVLKPGGNLLVSTLGEHYLSLDRLSPAERARFRAGELVVLYEDSSGSSLCSAYHPPGYVRSRLAEGFEYVRFLPAADDGRHDLHLLRKPTDPAASG